MLNIKPMLNTIIVVLVVVFSLPSVQANDMLAFNKESVNEIQEIIKRGKLVVAMYSKDSPPFIMLINIIS